ncbi:hypothetical protein [Anaerobium acetethylicum]|uniref:Uncharacterized protein n=1 Tax=Anaerobium acetethylicum TaxID=1619234 RepID=A0A1D3TU42_9FIRM|nr:hypothetical protein [Anaerobium acetethylicum]SCP97490.1 hypothetical protein SAMN05421730_101122 [Anaerobium acetethylicum]
MKMILEYSLKYRKSSSKILRLAGGLLWKIVETYARRQEKLVEREMAEASTAVLSVEEMLEKIRKNRKA